MAMSLKITSIVIDQLGGTLIGPNDYIMSPTKRGMIIVFHTQAS